MRKSPLALRVIVQIRKGSTRVFRFPFHATVPRESPDMLASTSTAAPPTAAAWRRSSARRRSVTSARNAHLRVVSRSIAEPAERSGSAPGSTSPPGSGGGDTRQKAIVIGGGVGGLGTASRLAHAGYEVTLLEKNADVGGRCRSESFEGEGAEGYRFDTGPSLMLLPDRYREQFTAVGKKMEVRIHAYPCVSTCLIVWTRVVKGGDAWRTRGRGRKSPATACLRAARLHPAPVKARRGSSRN